MDIQRERLLSLIEFTQQSARLRTKPVAAIADHRTPFALYEHDVQALPGIRINVNDLESEDEIWLAIQRPARSDAARCLSQVPAGRPSWQHNS